MTRIYLAPSVNREEIKYTRLFQTRGPDRIGRVMLVGDIDASSAEPDPKSAVVVDILEPEFRQVHLGNRAVLSAQTYLEDDTLTGAFALLGIARLEEREEVSA